MNKTTLPKLAAELAKGEPGSLVAFVLKAVQQAVKVAATGGVREHFQQQKSPEGIPWKKLAHARPDGSSRILQDRGTLAASVRCDVSGSEVTLTASHVAANVHQYGAMIRPKTAKHLAIPVTVEAKRAGSPRRFGKPLFTIRSGDTMLMIQKADGRKKKGDGKVQYVLVKSVTVPARPYLGFSDKTQDVIGGIVSDALADKVLAPFGVTPK